MGDAVPSAPAPAGAQQEQDHDRSHSSSCSSTCSSSDVAPKMQAQFHSLSSVLAETNENLLTFEFMLRQYRQMARVAPSSSAKDADRESVVDKAALSQSQLEASGRLEALLSDLAEAVGRVKEIKDSAEAVEKSGKNEAEAVAKPSRLHEEQISALEKEVSALRASLTQSDSRAESLSARNAQLESELSSRARTCQQLTESAHRSRAALQEERDRSEKLDRKLEGEQRAARKVGQDITRYVEHMRALEEEVAQLKREKKGGNAVATTARVSPVVNMQGDTLTVVQEEEGDDRATAAAAEATVAALRRQLEDERARSRSLLARLARHEEQEAESERQLAELKSGLVTLQRELEEKCRAVEELPLPHPTVMAPRQEEDHDKTRLESALREKESELAARDEDLRDLRSKTKSLLKRYDRSRSQLEERDSRLRAARRKATELAAECAAAERNYCVVLRHLGSEVEVCARLMAAYLGVEVAEEWRGHVAMDGRPLGEWFGDVQALSSWLREQLVAFGKRVWTQREPPAGQLPRLLPAEKATVAPPPRRKMKDREKDQETTKNEEGKDLSVAEALRSQEKLSKSRRDTLEYLSKVLID